MKPPAITFLIRSLEAGGAERQLVELATELHRSGWRVKVLTFYARGPLQEPLQRAGVPLVSLEKRGRWDLLFLPRLARYLRRDRPDIVHGYLSVPNILLALLRPSRETPVVWGVRASNMDLDRYDWLARIEFKLGTLLSRYADLIICNSEAGRAYHVDRGYRSVNTIVIPNGIDVGHFRPDHTTRLEQRREWQVGSHEKLVGLVARLDPMKDHPNFLRAASLVLKERSDTRFVCIGGGSREYRQQLQSLARSLGLEGKLTWDHERPDVWRAYNALDLAVSSSAFGEGFPNVVAEAMATEVPCVVTDVGDSAKVVGDTGWVCPPNDSSALAATILRALDASAGDRARIRARICSHFSLKTLAETTALQLLDLLGRRAESDGARPLRPHSLQFGRTHEQ